MNISFQNVAKVSALLTVTVEKADYQEKVNKALKSLRQKIDMPGFRKGMVPMSLIQKRFGKGALEEELNNIVSQGVNNYLKENNIHTLGQPVGNAQQPELDFDVMENFTFMIDVALAPEINVELGTHDTIDYYNIDVTDEMVQAQVDMYASRNG
ncbi:MAG: trigger factor family protein, partial [Prevotellaceae bacterium]|nr:trigger factor family protein [Prevotellaceae bacterium]